ncbi:BRO-N domain-containing protein [Actinomyces urogenitalis]|uniref:BRO-N domain-containing protein n=1 Tax=Actinomyces urogenitalis TaxID=103621 RepID=UPI0018979B6E|nr:BRO family protein [Actinomyces urogenitalis]MDK8236771.1 BRO family protein [Actinomyces urogenitalis]WOO94836.1 BRO family protein [Actinomyces urogenitalis]
MSTATPTTTFTYDGQQIRTTVTDTGEPLFALIDLCRVLEINNPSQVARRLDDDELTLIQAEGKRGRHRLNAVTEAGMYEVVLRSDKPEARTFRRWITHEVLPQLRRTGTYTTPQHSQPVLPHAGQGEPAPTVTRQQAGMHTIDSDDLVPRVEPCHPVERMPMSYGLVIVTGTTTSGRRIVDELMRPDARTGWWVSLRLRDGAPAHVITDADHVERYWLASAVRLRHVDAAAQVLASTDPVVRARGAGALLTEMVGTAITA